MKVVFEDEKYVTHPSAWLGLFKLKDNDRNYISYQPINPMSRNGRSYSVTMKMPRACGHYVVRYFNGVDSTSLATSKPIYVGPYVKMNYEFLSKEPEKLKVTYEQTFGLIHINSGQLNCQRSDGFLWATQPVTKSAGDLVFQKPPMIGQYRFEFFWENSLIAVSQPFDVKGSDSLNVEVEDDGVKDVLIRVHVNLVSVDSLFLWPWVGLFRKGDAHTTILDYHYIPTLGRSVISFGPYHQTEKEKTVTDYDVRLFYNTWIPDHLTNKPVGVTSSFTLQPAKVDVTATVANASDLRKDEGIPSADSNQVLTNKSSTTTTSLVNNDKTKKEESKKVEEPIAAKPKVVPKSLKKPVSAN